MTGGRQKPVLVSVGTWCLRASMCPRLTCVSPSRNRRWRPRRHLLSGIMTISHRDLIDIGESQVLVVRFRLQGSRRTRFAPADHRRGQNHRWDDPACTLCKDVLKAIGCIGVESVVVRSDLKFLVDRVEVLQFLIGERNLRLGDRRPSIPAEFLLPLVLALVVLPSGNHVMKNVG